MRHGGSWEGSSQALASSLSHRDGEGHRNPISRWGDAAVLHHASQAGSPSQPALSGVFTAWLGCFYNQAFVVLKNEHNNQTVLLLSYSVNKMVSF